MEHIQIIAFGGVAIILLLTMLYLLPLQQWFKAAVSGIPISLTELILMRFRRTPVSEVVDSLIISTKGGLSISLIELESVSLSGGNLKNIVYGMVAAKNAGFPLSFANATKADAQGLDIMKSVKDKLSKTKEVVFE